VGGWRRGPRDAGKKREVESNDERVSVEGQPVLGAVWDGSEKIKCYGARLVAIDGGRFPTRLTMLG